MSSLAMLVSLSECFTYKHCLCGLASELSRVGGVGIVGADAAQPPETMLNG